MERRQALMALGVLAAGLAGRFVVHADEIDTTVQSFIPAQSIEFDEGSIKFIRFHRSDGTVVEVSMKEIIDAIAGGA